MFSWGTEKLQDIAELPCNCPVCSSYTADELRKLPEKDRIKEIAKHNLYVSFAELKRIRNAISQGSLWELVETRANENPYLLEALKVLRSSENKDWLERFEPVSRNKAMFYTGSQTFHRPVIYRIHKRLLERFTSSKNYVVLPEGGKPFSSHYSNEIKQIYSKNSRANIIVDSSLGVVPVELDEMYPFAQSVFPEYIDDETEKKITGFFHEFTSNANVISWMGINSLDELESFEDRSLNIDNRRISAVCDMQFGVGSGKVLLDGDIKIVKSKKTGKIRNIYCDDKHVLSMRASDGLFTLKLDGAKLLHHSFKKPFLRVIVDKDAVDFVKEGKSVFSKFVKDCDSDLRPYDECLVVDEKDKLLAAGRCILNKEEMLSFDYGMAVKIRENI
jgi:7-cyano-7-deazaguanine tRNA-ribosyltransferase